jgi:hypothetical protein
MARDAVAGTGRPTRSEFPFGKQTRAFVSRSAQLLRLNPKFSVESYAKQYKDPAVAERFVDALREAGLKRRG